MALGDVLFRDTFFNLLPIANQVHWLPDQAEYNRTGLGEQLGADLGDRLWTGEIEFGRMRREEAGRVEVLIDLLTQTGRAFHVYDSRRPAPLMDPTMSILGAATPTILSLPSGDPREMSLTGLPAGYVLSPGDYLSWTYGSSPLRYALHRVVSGVTAGGGGNTAVFEVSPYIQPGSVTGTAVTLFRPFCKAVLLPGSVQPNRTRHTISEGLRLAYVQTVR
jgi:hypothetical protein